MAFGLPIINSLPGELAKIVSTHRLGLNYTAGSAESLAAAVKKFLVDAEERKACANRARLLYNESYNADTIYAGMAQYLSRNALTVPSLS
jgi:hypothetical protein